MADDLTEVCIVKNEPLLTNTTASTSSPTHSNPSKDEHSESNSDQTNSELDNQNNEEMLERCALSYLPSATMHH